MKTPKNILSMVYSDLTRIHPSQCHSLFLRSRSGCFPIETSGTTLNRSYIGKLTKEPTKGERKYMHGKLKSGKNALKLIFLVKTFHMTCIAMQQQF